MSNFKEALIESDRFAGEEFEYFYNFINPSNTIPSEISKKVNNSFRNEKKGVQHCISLIITNLLLSGIIAYSRSDRHYAKQRRKYYTKTNISKAVNILHENGYIIERRGYKNIRFQFGVASRLYSTEKLYQDYPIPVEDKADVKEIPLLQFNNYPIYNTSSLKKYLRSAKPSTTSPTLPYTPLQLFILSQYGGDYAQLLSESRNLNRNYWNRMILDFSQLPDLTKQPMTQVSLTRIFNDDGCGRWYQKGGLSYQQLSKEERTLLTLNGKEVVELDYSAMHPHILYAWEREQCPDDFYERITKELGLPYNEQTKFVVKKICLSSVNASDEKILQKSISNDKKEEINANKKRRKEGRKERDILYDELKHLELNFKEVVEAFRQEHPKIAEYIYSGSANRLMLDESSIMTAVLFELKSKRIPALPVHDSVIVPKQKEDDVRQVMIDQYKRFTGFDITVK